MGKIANLMETGFAGLSDVLEFRKHRQGSQQLNGTTTYAKPEDKINFRSFIFGNQQNRNYFFIALLSIVLQFVFFKFLYPFPDFISDSYSYIDTNVYHMDVNLWPIGYSKFLLLIHQISASDTFLIAVQFIILELSLIYFFYSVLYLYPLSPKYCTTLFIFLFLNPIFIFLSNCVLSDAIFCAISLTIFTQYLWMLRRPKLSYIIITTLLIGMAFTIRYTAIYYPIIAIVALLLSRQKLIVKLAGIIAPWFLIIPFIIYTQQKTKQVTGTAEFSVFGGWQLANNALYMYDHINVDSNKLSADIRELDWYAKRFYEKVPPENRVFGPFPGTYFIKVPFAVLKPYMLARYQFTTPPEQFKAWGKVSPIYQKYGSYLVRNYPFAFARYYLWLNAKNYFIPHLEKFGSYNIGMDSVFPVAKTWFQYKTSTVTAISSDLQQDIFFFYPLLFAIINLYFIATLLYIFFNKKIRRFIDRSMAPGVILTVFTLLINFAFSVFATPVVLRYQIFPMIVLVSYSLLFSSLLDRYQLSKREVKDDIKKPLLSI